MSQKKKINSTDDLKKEISEEDKKVKNVLFSLIAVTILVLIVLGLSFATYQQEHKKNNFNSFKTQNISMNYTESLNGISIINAVPTSDSVGEKLSGKGEYFDFTINSTLAGNANVEYEIAAMKDINSTIPDSNIKLYLEQVVSGSYEEVMKPTLYTPIKEQSSIGSPSGSMILHKVERTESGVDSYRLRMWIKEDAQIEVTQKYIVRVNVYGKAL